MTPERYIIEVPHQVDIPTTIWRLNLVSGLVRAWGSRLDKVHVSYDGESWLIAQGRPRCSRYEYERRLFAVTSLRHRLEEAERELELFEARVTKSVTNSSFLDRLLEEASRP